MYRYKIQIKRVSGLLKEGALPKKNLVYKSNTKKTEKEVLKQANKFLLSRYNVEVNAADVIVESASEGELRDAITQELVRNLYIRVVNAQRFDPIFLPEGIIINTENGSAKLYGGKGNTEYGKLGQDDVRDAYGFRFAGNEFDGLMSYRDDLYQDCLSDDWEGHTEDDNEDEFWKELENISECFLRLETYDGIKEEVTKMNYEPSRLLLRGLKSLVDKIVGECLNG